MTFLFYTSSVAPLQPYKKPIDFDDYINYISGEKLLSSPYEDKY